MKRVYDTGIDTNTISLGVKVATVGTAYTSVHLVRKGGQSDKIRESDEFSGNIKEELLGDAKQFKVAYLIIRITIDFSNISEDKWPDQIDHVIVKYHINGGFSGNQVYNFDTDDVDIVFNGKIVVITKPIEMI